MKTRIKQVKDASGRSRYFPQFRLFFLWFDYGKGVNGSLEFDNFRSAEKFIQTKKSERIIYHDR